TLVAYMEEEELLTVARQTSGRIAWEPLKGFNAAMKRSKAVLGGGNKPFMLARSMSVVASITPLEPGFVHVGLEADIREARGSFIGGATAVSCIGIAGALAIATLGAPLLGIVVVPMGLELGWGVLR